MEPDRQRSERILMMTRIIWGGLLLPILLALIAWVLPAGQPAWPETVSFSDTLVLLFLLVAALGFVIVFSRVPSGYRQEER